MKKPKLIKYPNGIKKWCLNGKLHREDGPAYESYTGKKLWFHSGKLHREDGPAIESPNGKKYYIENKNLSEKQFNLHRILINKFKTPKEISFKIIKLLKYN